MRIGLIARADNSGLGNQTRNLAYMLKPSKILVVNSKSFARSKKMNLEWYEGFNGYVTKGWPTNAEVRVFLRGIDVLITCETFYNNLFITEARRLGIKTILQYNFEFLDLLVNPNHPKPDMMISPSHWKLNEVDGARYLPPPINSNQFRSARDSNLGTRTNRLLHIVGQAASHDRNGTEDLIAALQYTDYNFELVIKSQGEMVHTDDPRVTYDYSNPGDESDLYKRFDAMILPRRYAGLCLPMNEALMSGLPVLMPDTTPYNNILPKKWLYPAFVSKMIMTRTLIECHSSDTKSLAKKIEEFIDSDIESEKLEAFDIGYNNYSYDSLRDKYKEIIDEVCRR